MECQSRIESGRRNLFVWKAHCCGRVDFAEYYVGAGTRQRDEEHKAMTQEARQLLKARILLGCAVSGANGETYSGYFCGKDASQACICGVVTSSVPLRPGRRAHRVEGASQYVLKQYAALFGLLLHAKIASYTSTRY